MIEEKLQAGHCLLDAMMSTSAGTYSF